MRLHRLQNKSVILTGASSGFGWELAKRLVLTCGCTVYGVARSEEKLSACVQSLGEKGARFVPVVLDVSDRGAWQTFRARLVRENVVPDLLINNAGVLPAFRRFGDMPAAEIERVFQINALGAVYGTHAILPLLLRAPDPMLFNVCSSAALSPVAGAASYAASKAALKALTEGIRGEYMGRLYAGYACPGLSVTPLYRGQSAPLQHPLLALVQTPPDKVAARILHAIARGKKRTVIGLDARCMQTLYRLCPCTAQRLFSAVLKRAGLEAYRPVFDQTGADGGFDAHEQTYYNEEIKLGQKE